MRKEELIHLHALLDEVCRHLRETGAVPADAFTEYRACGVSPVAIHRRKEDHREAVRLLADGVVSTVESRRGTRDDREARPPVSRPPSSD